MASGEQIEVTYYLNDVSDDLSQVLMTYNDDGVYDTAYTYGIERVGIDILDGSRPDAQNPLFTSTMAWVVYPISLNQTVLYGSLMLRKY